ncbi:MAG: STAS domain-containing protein [Porticoccaceae bacterium]
MEMEVTELDGKAIKIALLGRLDTPGVDQIETRFSASIVPGGHQAIVDLSGVSFIASMGLRMFITVARSASKRGGKLVLLSPQAMVNEVFTNAALSDIIPVVFSVEEALGQLNG